MTKRWDVLKKFRRRSEQNQYNTDFMNINPINTDVQPVRISPNLSDNLQRLNTIFSHCDDFVILHWRYGPNMEHTAFSVYFDSLVLKKELNYMKESLQDLVTHEVGPGTMITPKDVMSFFGRNGVSAQSHCLVEDFDQVVKKVASGYLVIFFNQWDKALSYKAKGIEARQVTESVTEPVVKGPRESTVECFRLRAGWCLLPACCIYTGNFRS
jgi:spore germination protein KA/spore germination protein